MCPWLFDPLWVEHCCFHCCPTRGQRDHAHKGLSYITEERNDMNIVFINSDSFRRDHVGAYGNKWISTPNLDRFAAESVVLDRA